MRAQSLKSNKSPHGGFKNRRKSPLPCELRLNDAFDSLNAAELKTQSISTEMGDLLASALDVAVKLYRNSHSLYQNKEFKKSETFAKVAIELSKLIESLAEQELQNVRSLPAPPPLPRETTPKVPKSRAVHPSLLAFESFLKRKSSSGSRYYNQKLIHFPKVINRATQCLDRIEKIH